MQGVLCALDVCRGVSTGPDGGQGEYGLVCAESQQCVRGWQIRPDSRGSLISWNIRSSMEQGGDYQEEKHLGSSQT